MAAAGSPIPEARRRPRLRVNKWWTGGYVAEDGAGAVGGDGNGVVFYAGTGPVPKITPEGVSASGIGVIAGWRRKPTGLSARQQIESARARVVAARERAQARRVERRERRSGDFATMNIGVGMALLILLAAVGALFFGVLSPRRVVSMSPRVEFGSDDEARGFMHGALPGAGQVGTLVPHPEGATNRRGTPRLEVNGRTVNATSPAAAASVSGERALVISDVQPVPGSAAWASVVSATERLKTVGFELVGNYPGRKVDAETIKAEIGLEAAAQKVRSIDSLEQESVLHRLSEWMADQGNLDLLVWFAKAGNEGDLHYFVVTPAARNGSRAALHNAVFRTGVLALDGRLN